jgi:hypothetical protein
MSWKEKRFERERRMKALDKNRWKKKLPKKGKRDEPLKDINHPDFI